MKLSIKSLISGAIASSLILFSASMVHADKGGRGGNRSSFSGSSARMGSSMSSSTSRSSSTKSTFATSQNLSSRVTPAGNAKTNLTQNSPAALKKAGSPVNPATSISNLTKASSFKKSSVAPMVTQPLGFSKAKAFCGTPWTGGGCFTNYCGWNHCHHGFGFGCGWYYPWHNHCWYPAYYPCFTTCYTPICDYCYTSPFVYTYQSPVVVTQVIEQAPPIAEAPTTTMANETAAIKPPSTDVSFLTSSALQP